MVKADGVDRHEVGQVVLVRIVVTMPGYDIKGGVALKGRWGREREREGGESIN